MPRQPRTVLLVDDDAAVRSALKFLLEMEGFEVRLYDRAASLLADPNLPARGCIVVDMRMPGMDGLELLETLRARHVDLPAILIVSERPGPQLSRRASRSGVRNVLEKPLTDRALVESLEGAFAAYP
jgi:FixJ family two-component response regulator